MEEQLLTLGEVIDRLQFDEIAVETVHNMIIWFNPETNRLEYMDEDEDPIVIVFNTKRTKQGDRIWKIVK